MSNFILYDKAYEYKDIRQLKSIYILEKLEPSLSNIQKIANQYGLLKNTETTKYQRLLTEYNDKLAHQLEDEQIEKLETLEREYLMFSNKHLANVYGMTEDKVEQLFSNVFGIKFTNRGVNATIHRRKPISKLSDVELSQMTKVQRCRAKKLGYVIIPK